MNMGLCFNDLGKKDDAIKCYFRAVELEPTNESCVNNLTLLLKNSGRKKEGIPFLTKIKESFPDCKIIDDAIRRLK